MKSAHACESDNTVYPPKLLPWLAAEACISEATALRLWQAAVAKVRSDGSTDSASLNVKAMGYFRDALAEERQNAGISVFIRSLRVIQRRVANQFLAFLSVLLMKRSQRA